MAWKVKEKKAFFEFWRLFPVGTVRNIQEWNYQKHSIFLT